MLKHKTTRESPVNSINKYEQYITQSALQTQPRYARRYPHRVLRDRE